MPAFNVEDTIEPELESLDALELILRKKKGIRLEVAVVDDCSKDNTEYLIQKALGRYSWLTYLRNSENLKNARTVIRGWNWVLNGAEDGPIDDRRTLGWSTDADREFDKMAIWRFLCDGRFNDPMSVVVGSVNYSEYLASEADYRLKRRLGKCQAEAIGADFPFTVQSPGSQYYRLSLLRPVITEDVLAYWDFLKENGHDVPPWGCPGANLALAAARGAKIHTEYLACFSAVPNSSDEKRAAQEHGCMFHIEWIKRFLAARKARVAIV